jgi:uncharacterized iron-regulated membrane protein
MIHLLFLFHRYLGIAVGALMAMWCVSGVVMMYVSYPGLQENSRRHHLAPIVWSSCCKISDEVLADDDPVSEFQVEMLAGRPVLQLRSGRKYRLIDLVAGSVIDRVSTHQAVGVAKAFAEEALPVAPQLLGLIDHDQWTVSGSFNADRPLYHFSMADEMRTELYVSSTTGHAVQITTARERFWNWVGSVPHWLYFAELRRRPSLWSQIVILTSLIGCFLTVTGIYIGVRQLVHRPAGRWSPYCGFNLWHHAAGLFFGAFTLAWILSGLLSMNPWGWLEGADSQAERAQLRGEPEPSGAQLKAALAAVVRGHPIDVVSLDIAPLDGRLYLIASTAGDERQRLSAGAVPTPLNDVDLAHAAGVLGGAGAAPAALLLTREDSYYFSHHRDVARLPVYRVILGDGTRYYMDAVSGALVAKIDHNAKAYRWLHKALHRMDFAVPLRSRPQWDALMLLLMSGVTVLCVTGVYLGYRRLVRRRSEGLISESKREQLHY